jgi:hypothetical protein
MIVVAKITTKIASIGINATNDDVAQEFADETSRMNIDNGRSRMGFRIRSDDSSFTD